MTPAELVFTSGGTESNNLAVFGVARAFRGRSAHMVITAIEHPAVLEAARQLETEGVEVTRVGPDANGTVPPGAISEAIRPNTVLVSVMHANNEIGTVQPIEEIAAAVRVRRNAGQEIYFHSDGVQALGKVALDLRQLGVDLYSVSAHKVYAPKGTGALFLRKGIPLVSITAGGRHEGGRRAGTENVVGAMAFAMAVELLNEDAAVHSASLRDEFERQLLASRIGAEINGAGGQRLPNTSNILFRGVSAENLVIALDLKGIAVSTGSACSSGSVEPSHVLLAIGLSRENAKSSLRVSFGADQTAGDVRALSEALITLIARQRSSERLESRVAV